MRSKLATAGTRLLTCAALIAAGLAFLSTASAKPPVKQAKQTKPAEKKSKSKKKTTQKVNHAKKTKEAKTKMPALHFKMKDINGKEQDLQQYHGNVIMMINVASKCGLTPQYEGLEKLYEKYKDKGFVILGFPANNFLKQEPGTDKEIKAFCTKNYGVTFPMFSKVSVKGKDMCDLYKYLTDKKAGHKFGGTIQWNFDKFIINRDGEIVARFSPRTTPEDKKLVAEIEKELKAEIPADSPLAKKKPEKKEKKPEPAKQS